MAFIGVPIWLELILLLCIWTALLCMAPLPAKRARKLLTLETKQDILGHVDVDAGWPNARLVQHYNLAKSTLCMHYNILAFIFDAFY